MDSRSEAILAHVHPDLAKVIRGAAQSPQPFEVIQGLRTHAAEVNAVATGHSTTMHSRHLPDPHYATPEDPAGVACAVDVAALIGGKVNFAVGRESEVFGQIWDQIAASADDFKIPVQWGGDWISFKDWGHVQLSWGDYP